MKTKWAFIPCAGFGTRMGKVGKLVPKPLFKYYEKTLLDHQITFCRRLGFENFIINSHYQADKLEAWSEAFSGNLINLYEEELLGNGGSFHNIKKNLPKVENVYVFNPDSLLLISLKFWNKLFSLENKYQHILFSVPCSREDKYNRFKLDNEGFLQEIIPYYPGAPSTTYAGFGKVNLSNLTLKEGVSSFFESVVRPGKDEVHIIPLGKDAEYFDFGTEDLFKEKVVSLSTLPSLLEFMRETSGINQELMRESGYASNQQGVYDFRSTKSDVHKEGIYFDLYQKEFTLSLP